MNLNSRCINNGDMPLQRLSSVAIAAMLMMMQTTRCKLGHYLAQPCGACRLDLVSSVTCTKTTIGMQVVAWYANWTL